MPNGQRPLSAQNAPATCTQVLVSPYEGAANADERRKHKFDVKMMAI
jgi:hypothetical protein